MRRYGSVKQLEGKGVAEAYRAGVTIRALALEHGVSYGTVHRFLVQAGVERRPRGSQQIGMG